MGGKYWQSGWTVALTAWVAAWAAQGASFTVDMVGSAFVPASVAAHTGDSVTWVQQDSVAHTTTSGTSPTPNGIWNSGLMTLASNTRFSFTFANPGTYPYFCTVHSSFMKGAVTVAAATNAPPAPIVMAGPVISGTNLTLRWQGGLGPYQVQRKSSLGDAAWTTVATTTNLQASFGIGGSAAFFRIAGSAQALAAAGHGR